MKIDYPDTLEEFSNLYWDSNTVYDYYIFYNNGWLKPWVLDDIYESVLKLIYDLDVQNGIFDKKNYSDYISDEDEDT